jgi:hypothetical protein
MCKNVAKLKAFGKSAVNAVWKKVTIVLMTGSNAREDPSHDAKYRQLMSTGAIAGRAVQSLNMS